MSNYLKIIVLCLLIPLSISAQEGRRKQNPYKTSRRFDESVPVRFSALGAWEFYGVKFGLDVPLRFVETRKFSGFNAGRSMREMYLGFDAGLWHHAGFHENAFLAVEWKLRKVSGNGMFWQIVPLSIGGSYLLESFEKRAVVAKDVPEINRFYAMPSVSAAVGKDFGWKMRGRGIPLTLFLGGGFSSLYPYRDWKGYYFGFAELGASYRVGGIRKNIKRVRKE